MCRSAIAAGNIKSLIEDSVGKVEEGSKLVDQSGAVLNDIVSSVKKVSDIVAEISAASLEQSRGIEQVNEAVTQIDEVTQQNATLVEQAASSAESLRAQSQKLSESMARFEVGEESSARETLDLNSPPHPLHRRMRRSPSPFHRPRLASKPIV
jgi:methyl-accepting chemotaxis protein